MKVALVHDYLNESGGAERVLRVLADMYPDAPIYTAFAKYGTAQEMFRDRKIIESPWAPLLKIGRFYSYFRFLLPFVWRSIDLTHYDLVITSTSGGYIARGFRVGTSTRVVAYCHTPPKWLYGYATPTGAMHSWWGRAFMWLFGPHLRYFDFTSAQRVNTWIANSEEVARRIAKFYRQKAYVVYPPVTIESDPKSTGEKARDDYYLLVTRVTGAKGVLEAIEAAEKGHFRLLVVGETIEKRMAAHLHDKKHWVEFRGRVADTALASLYAQAKGFIALAKDEDFGMTVVEAMTQGTPVLALASGGYKETVKQGTTGVLIESTDPQTVLAGLTQMENTKWDRPAIKKWATRFDRKKFEIEIRRIVGA